VKKWHIGVIGEKASWHQQRRRIGVAAARLQRGISGALLRLHQSLARWRRRVAVAAAWRRQSGIKSIKMNAAAACQRYREGSINPAQMKTAQKKRRKTRRQ